MKKMGMGEEKNSTYKNSCTEKKTRNDRIRALLTCVEN